MNIPEWATDVLRFEGGPVVYYNKEQWEYVSNDEVDPGKWLNVENLAEYLTDITEYWPHTHEVVKITLENK